MDPEVVLVLLVFLTAAPTAMLAGCLRNSRSLEAVSPGDMERPWRSEIWAMFMGGLSASGARRLRLRA